MRGPWHQFGDRSQRFALELLQSGAGVGVVISPRDLSWDNAKDYSQQYHGLNAQVLIDQQFYIPDYSNPRMESYPISHHRISISQLCQIPDAKLRDLSNQLRIINSELSTEGLIAPAVVYESGRQDIFQLNERLFSAAKLAGDDLGIPTFASVMLGQSITASDYTIDVALSQITSLQSDGWYLGFQFEDERIPSSIDSVSRFCQVSLTLACMGKPVLHAYAGPMALLSFGAGVTGVCIGHFQNLWKFSPRRWQVPASQQGGGGDAPPRFFSTNLWGTIIYPDELVQLPLSLRNRIITPSPFSSSVTPSATVPWSRWEANKHLVYSICSTIDSITSSNDPRANANSAIQVLDNAISLHDDIKNHGFHLADNTDAYQANWREALINLLSNNSSDYDYLDLIS